jgi:nitrogen fixation/metabolism regulation signal transduction histidine kinase
MVLALVLAHNIVGPVRQLTSIADRVSNGDIKQEVNVQASGEIGELADSFKRMVNAFKIMDSMANADAPGGE